MESRILLARGLETPDGTKLFSRYRHDYVTHSDKNGKLYMIDGGSDYLKHSNHEDEIILEYYSTDPIEILREVIGRGGYGKNGDEEYRFSLLKDMDEDWIQNSIDYVLEHSGDMGIVLASIYTRELNYRRIL